MHQIDRFLRICDGMVGVFAWAGGRWTKSITNDDRLHSDVTVESIFSILSLFHAANDARISGPHNELNLVIVALILVHGASVECKLSPLISNGRLGSRGG